MSGPQRRMAKASPLPYACGSTPSPSFGLGRLTRHPGKWIVSFPRVPPPRYYSPMPVCSPFRNFNAWGGDDSSWAAGIPSGLAHAAGLSFFNVSGMVSSVRKPQPDHQPRRPINIDKIPAHSFRVGWVCEALTQISTCSAARFLLCQSFPFASTLPLHPSAHRDAMWMQEQTAG